MGTDIHAVFQRRNKTTNTWEDIPSDYDESRHYQLFAILAGVRNGRGFAGILTGNPVVPIAEPRGLPEDFEVIGDYMGHPRHKDAWPPDTNFEWYDGYAPDVYIKPMGDHSFSWVTADEILNYPYGEVRKYGVVDRAFYESWDHKTAPCMACGAISGVGIIRINDIADEHKAHPNWTHIRISWAADLSDECKYFIDEVKRLKELHGEVRMVFGFDS